MKQRYPRLAVLGAGLLLAACNQATPQSPPTPPAPEVSVIEVHPQSVPLNRQLVGRLAPTRVAQVRARVAGIILKRVYTEGTDVRQGDVLYLIDPAPLKAALHAQEAVLAKARADAVNAAATAKRYRELATKKLLATQDLDTALATERSTAAAVKQAQADVESARLDLGYATVTAPIAGRAGRALVTEGALVGQGEATQLTTIEQIDPIYVNFSQSAAELTGLEKVRDTTETGVDPNPEAKVEILLSDGSTYPYAGTIDFSDMAVNPGTGALSLRAVVPNPSKQLLPGMFVTLRLISGQIDDAFLLPQAAVQRDAAGAYVLVLNAEDKVEKRQVETRGMTREDWILTGSLRDGEQVIVSGLQKVKPGAGATIAPLPEASTAQDDASTQVPTRAGTKP